MKKFFRKFLIYLVMTMMVTPTWLVTGMLSAERAKAAEGNPTVESYLLNGKASDVYFASKAGDANPVEILVEADRAVKFNRLNVLSADGVEKYFTQTGMYSTSITKAWDGKTSGDVYVPDGIYRLQVKMTDQSEPPLEGEKILESSIIVDNTKPTVNSFLNSSVVLRAGQSGTFSVVFSEQMNTMVAPDVILEDGLAEAGFEVMGSWLNNTTFNLKYTVPNNLSASVAPSKIMIKDAIDVAGNMSADYVSNGTVSLDAVAPKVNIVSPVEFDSVNGTEAIRIEADEKITSDCSVVISLNGADWAECLTDVTTLNDVPGFSALSDGPFTLYAAVIDLAGNPASSDSKVHVELIKDTKVNATVAYSTTNPTNKPVTATLVSDEDLIVLNNEGSNKYTFTENGTFTFQFEDAAGNTGSVTATVENIVEGDLILSPQITATVSGKSISISWEPVKDAVSYIVYSSPKVSGLISDSYKGVYVNVGNVTNYVLNVADYGEYYVTVTAIDQYGNESPFLTEFTGQRLVTVKAPAQVVEPAPTPATTVVEEPTTVAAPVTVAAPRAKAEENKEEVAATTKDDEGEIKGDESATEEDNKVNWTPWIVLFVLIILAGAATGGYFYWFNGEDEVSAVVRERKVVHKETAPVKEASKKVNGKKSKRW